MFGRSKDTKSSLDKATEALKTPLDILNNAELLKANTTASTEPISAYNTATTTGYGAHLASAYRSTATADYDLQLKIYDILRDMHAKVAGRMNYVNAIKRITDALDSFECPVSECKACKHYTPGRVDGCDKHAAIAEFLVAHRIVEVPLDNSETV